MHFPACLTRFYNTRHGISRLSPWLLTLQLYLLAGAFGSVMRAAPAPDQPPAAATLSVNFAVLPGSQTVAVGGNLVVDVQVNFPQNSTIYGWFITVNDRPVPTKVTVLGSSATSLSVRLTAGPLAASDSGSFTIGAPSSTGYYLVSDRIQLIVLASAPSIISAPTDRDATVGEAVRFSVEATGADLRYQWRKNGADINGATDTTFEINSAQTTDAGTYTCIVANSIATLLTPAARLTVSAPSAPTITTQPGSATYFLNSPVNLSVTARGTQPLAYQWARDGVPIAGATSATYALARFTPADAGPYTVTVSNSLGSVTSEPAELIAAISAYDPTITLQPVSRTIAVGSNAAIAVAALGLQPQTYQWSKDGQARPGATRAELAFTPFTAADAGVYTVTVANNNGRATSAPATLSIGTPAVSVAAPLFLVQPPEKTIRGVPDQGTQAVVEAQALTFNNANIFWGSLISGIPTPVASSLVARSGNNVFARLLLAVDDTAQPTYQLTVTNPYGIGLSTPRALTKVANATPDPWPSDLTVTAAEGQSLQLENSAPSIGSPVYTQWLKNGNPIAGATAAKFTLASAAVSDSGTYTLTLTTPPNPPSRLESYVARYNFNVTVSAGFPVIITQPADVTAEIGASAALTLTATSPASATYQWYRNGEAVAGATSATLAFPSLASTQAGTYFAVVRNPTGLTASRLVTVTAQAASTIPAGITAPPTAATVTAGGATSLSVTARGTGPITYQWFKDGSAVAGATSATLSLPAAGSATAGSYFVRVTNTAGTADSPPVTVTVTDPPRLINLSLLTDLAAGDSVTLGFVTGGDGTSGAKPLLLRAAGPTLGSFGVAGAHPDPQFELFRGTEKIAANDNWNDDPGARGGAVFTAVGAFAFASPASRDAALLAPGLAAGAYSVRISGTGLTAGTTLAELYETTPGAAATTTTPRLINVSVLKKLGAGFTVGFVVGGSGTKKVLVRAVGPALAGFCLGDAAADPALTLKDNAGAIVASNDNWLAADAATMTAVGGFALPAASKDAALVSTLSPGSYTLQVSATGANATGSVLVEVYEVP